MTELNSRSNTRTRHILELKIGMEMKCKKMSERKAYMDEAWEEDHAT